ncbi:transposase [Rhodococcus opacus]|uniref:transposase n=1 Tax=Rhodococcus opacus TaxID=37919 RepID=UPI0017D4BC57
MAGPVVSVEGCLPCPVPVGISDRAQGRGCPRLINSGRTVVSVARDLGLNERVLESWVADERRRTEAAAQVQAPLSLAERDELTLLRKQVAEQEKDTSFFNKRRRTLRRTIRSSAFRADGCRVRRHRYQPDGASAARVDLRIRGPQNPFHHNGTDFNQTTSSGPGG